MTTTIFDLSAKNIGVNVLLEENNMMDWSERNVHYFRCVLVQNEEAQKP